MVNNVKGENTTFSLFVCINLHRLKRPRRFKKTTGRSASNAVMFFENVVLFLGNVISRINIHLSLFIGKW